jgi:hypothetical protein
MERPKKQNTVVSASSLNALHSATHEIQGQKENQIANVVRLDTHVNNHIEPALDVSLRL